MKDKKEMIDELTDEEKALQLTLKQMEKNKEVFKRLSSISEDKKGISYELNELKWKVQEKANTFIDEINQLEDMLLKEDSVLGIILKLNEATKGKSDEIKTALTHLKAKYIQKLVNNYPDFIKGQIDTPASLKVQEVLNQLTLELKQAYLGIPLVLEIHADNHVKIRTKTRIPSQSLYSKHNLELLEELEGLVEYLTHRVLEKDYTIDKEKLFRIYTLTGEQFAILEAENEPLFFANYRKELALQHLIYALNRKILFQTQEQEKYNKLMREEEEKYQAYALVLEELVKQPLIQEFVGSPNWTIDFDFHEN